MTKKEKEIVELIVKRKKLAYDYKQKWTKQARKNINAFMNSDGKKKKAEIFMPYTYWVIKTKLARDLDPLYTPENLVEIKPQEKNDENNAKLSEIITNWYLKNTPDFKIKLWMLHLQKRICGISPFIVTYEQKRKKVIRRKKDKKDKSIIDTIKELFGLVKTDDTEEVEKVIQYPNFETINFFDFFIEPKAKSIKEARYVGRVLMMDLKTLRQKAKEGRYKNIKEVEKIISSRSSNTTSTQKAGGEKDAKVDDSYKMVEITEYWEDDRVVTIAEDKILLRDTPNPYWHKEKPFGALVNDPELNEFYGRGEPELIEDLQKLYNDLVNQRLESEKKGNSPIMLVKKGSGENVKKLKSKPGEWWQLERFENIKILDIPGANSSVTMNINETRNDIERFSFVSGYQTGSNSPQLNDTATGVSIITSEANKIFHIHQQLDESMGIEIIGDFYLKLLIQFLTEEKAIRIAGENGDEWKEISPDNLIENYDLSALGASKMVNKQAYLQQLIMLYQLLMNEPEINKGVLIRKILEAAEMKGIDKIIMKQQLGTGPPNGMMPNGVSPPDIPDIADMKKNEKKSGKIPLNLPINIDKEVVNTGTVPLQQTGVGRL